MTGMPPVRHPPIRLGAGLLSAAGIFCLLFVVYLPYTGSVHLFDWDELIFAEAAREMLESGNFGRVFVNYVPFWEKPPGFFWLQALSFHWFGVNEGAARLPSVLFTAATGAVLCLAGTFVGSISFGVLWALLFGLSPLPSFFGRFGLIDPTFNFFVVTGILCLFAHDETRRHKSGEERLLPVPVWLPGGYLTISALSIGTAVLIKGPLGLVVPLVCFGVYKLLVREPRLSVLQLLLFLGGTLLVASSWFAVETLNHGSEFVTQFVTYQMRISGTNDGHPGPVYFHALVYLLGSLPCSVFLVRGILWRSLRRERRFQILALVWFVFVLLLFSLIQTKLLHYTLLIYMPGAFLAACVLQSIWQGRTRVHPLELTALGVLGLILAVPLLLVPYLARNPQILKQLVADPGVYYYLEVPVAWGVETFAPGVLWVAGIVLTIVLFALSRPRLGITTLLVSSAVMMNLFWIVFMTRVDTYVSAPIISFIEQVGDAPFVYYGPRTFLPPFYARRQVANPSTPEQLAVLLREQPDLQVVTPRTEMKQLAGLKTLKVLDRNGAYALLGAEPTQKRQNGPIAVGTPIEVAQ